MDASSQVGNVSGIGAVLWQGPVGSRVDLQPPGVIRSNATAVRGNMQVGGVSIQFDVSHAALWRGSAASFVDLHPQGSVRSTALATDGLLQGGTSYWQIGSLTRARATLWNGTPESFVLLAPPDLISHVHGMAPGVQVGETQFQGARAALWRGTPESYIDMHPPGQPGTSRFYATTGLVHVGTMTQGGLGGAAINLGAPEAWLGLHQFLPPGFNSFSAAYAVHQEGSTIYVCGYAVAGSERAVMWIGTLPPECCPANCDQSTVPPYLNIDDFTCFINQFAGGQSLPFQQQLGHRANCDQSTIAPVLNVDDFTCFINTYAGGCE
jgi:hypothetical protein